VPIGAALVYLAVAVPLILRATPLESMMYAVPLIFFALSPTSYYYVFLVLLMLLPWERGVTDGVRALEMALLAFNAAVSWAFLLVSEVYLSLFYQVGPVEGFAAGASARLTGRGGVAKTKPIEPSAASAARMWKPGT
jgi:hypothetical protein